MRSPGSLSLGKRGVAAIHARVALIKADHGDRGDADAIPAVGGAMDLAVGAKRTCVMMEHLTKAGDSKIVSSCSYPLTAIGCAGRIDTDLAVVDVTPEGLKVIEVFNGLAFEELQRLSGVPLIP